MEFPEFINTILAEWDEEESKDKQAFIDSEDSVKDTMTEILSYYSQEIIAGMKKAKSPVERMYLLWLNDQVARDDYKVDDQTFISVVPQYKEKIGDKTYFVDFAIILIPFYPSDPLYKLFVEIDGHEFHEKTKQQASNDRKRERALLSKCDHLIRLTGSEVYKEGHRCAKETLSILRKKFHEKYAE